MGLACLAASSEMCFGHDFGLRNKHPSLLRSEGDRTQDEAVGSADGIGEPSV